MQANRMLSPLLGFALATFLAADASAQWSNIGIARLRLPTGGCDTPFGPANGELFAISANSWSEDSSALTLHRLYCIDGTVDRTRVDWSQRTGAWQVAWSYAGFLDTLTITIAAYPDPALVPLTEHRGLVLLDDESSESDGWLQTNVAQEIATPVLRPRVGENEILWAPPAFAGTSGTCESGGELVVPFFTGWNVYRLLRSDVPPGISTPDHYLCGPDLDCRTTADNGFVAFVPHVVAPDGLIHYSDTAIPSDPTLADYVYAVQPVKRGASRGGDADGDTITDEDLNGDGIPEFVDPAWVVGQNVARGLTGRIPAGPGFRKPILISPDSVTARDVLIYVRKVAGAYRVDWDALGPGGSSVGHDLHAGDFADFGDRVAFAARNRLACDLPDGPSSTPLVDPGFRSGNRYYLMSVAHAAGAAVMDEYGTDSFGVEHVATSTPPPCR